jgi:hypothetical protein
MLEVGVDFGNAIDGDSTALLDRKRMVCRLELDIGSYAVIPEMGAGLQIFCARIEWDFRGKPPEEGPICERCGVS